MKDVVLIERNVKRIKIIKKWIDGASKESIRKEYGDFGSSVIIAEEYKMRRTELDKIEFAEDILPSSKS